LYWPQECARKFNNDDLNNNDYNNDTSIVTSGTDADRERTDCMPARIGFLERSVTGYWLVLSAMGTSVQFRHL
jgi:hypothetical protein